MLNANEPPWAVFHFGWARGMSPTNREEWKTLDSAYTLILFRRRTMLGLSIADQVKSNIGWDLLIEAAEAAKE